MDVDLDGLKDRAHTTNFKNEVWRRIRPTNVLFIGILCRWISLTQDPSLVCRLLILTAPIESLVH